MLHTCCSNVEIRVIHQIFYLNVQNSGNKFRVTLVCKFVRAGAVIFVALASRASNPYYYYF